ncbi:MAG: M23 family metallopeptidase [Candidatus Cloacimonetes bacterium]|nr:M23 family metallopeptidase [Candidatus Cloacimonadota bacterium]
MSSLPRYYTPSSKYHIVQPGENLSNISSFYDISVSKLMLYNNLKNEKIFVGQKIFLVPRLRSKQEYITVRSLPASGYHVATSRETLSRIARMYDISLLDLIEFNNLDSFEISVGQKIYLRQGMAQESVKSLSDNKNPVTEKPLVDKSVPPLSLHKEITPDQLQVTHQTKPALPLEKGKVTSLFGLRNGKPHKGIDITAPLGSPIFAVLDGKVVYTGVQRGYGNVVIVEHANYIMTVYAHNESNLVRLGDDVVRGQPIATLGETGTTTGPHLHFEYRVRGQAVDPLEVLPDF